MLDHDGRLPCLRWSLLFGRRRDHRHLGLPLSPTRSHGARRPAGSRAGLGANRGPTHTAPSSKPPARKPAAGTKRLPSCAARGPAHTWSGGGLPGHNHSARGRGGGPLRTYHSARGWARGGGGKGRSLGHNHSARGGGSYKKPQTEPPALAEGRGLGSSQTSLASHRRFCKPPSR